MDRGHVKRARNSVDFSQSKYAVVSSLGNLKIDQSQFVRQSSSEKLKLNLLLERDLVAMTEERQEGTEIELRKEGRVEFSVHKSYAKFSSWKIAICFSSALMQASRNGNDLWLSYWVDSTSGNDIKNSTHFYLVILSIFCAINSLLTLIRAFSFSFCGLRAAVQVHTKLLNKLINAPVHFFDQNPSGRILNRLSSDLYMIDDSLPFIRNILLANFFSLLGLAVVLSYVQVILLLLLFPFAYIYKKLQFYYRSTSRELRRLDSVSHSPIYASFTETLDGSSTIRAFKTEILCLDECTANIDTRTTSILQKTISNECQGMTVVIIAHRISVTLQMDDILILENGTLA